MARKPALPGCDRRQQILQAALDLFAEQGLEGATSKAIAERAEVTHGLIYFYFKSKDELFRAAFAYALEQGMAQLNVSAIAESDEPPEEALTGLLTRFLQTLMSPYLATVMRLMMHTMARDDWRAGPLHECKLLVHSSVGEIVDGVRMYLDRQVALGRVRPIHTETVARFLIGGIMSSVRWSLGGAVDGDLPADTAATIADMCVRGLLTQAPAQALEPALTEG